MNLSGRWTGEYRYDQPSAGVGATFTLELKQGWFGRISGSVQDGPTGMPETGAVKGRLRGNRLTFRKEMPVLRVAKDGGTVPLSEWLAASGDLRIGPNTPHPSILYVGAVETDGGVISGVWSVSEHVVRLEGGVKVLQFPGYGGSWVARRRE